MFISAKLTFVHLYFLILYVLLVSQENLLQENVPVKRSGLLAAFGLFSPEFQAAALKSSIL